MGTFVPGPDSRPIRDVPAFCRVEAVLTPSPDSSIRIEVWMPAQAGMASMKEAATGGSLASLPTAPWLTASAAVTQWQTPTWEPRAR